MTQQVSFNREQFLKENPAFAAQVLNAFEDRGQDVKTRRYLALILGLVGDKSAVPALSAALKEDDSILVRNSLWVIGRVGDASTIPQIAPFTASDKPVLRLMAVFSLGSIDSSDTLPYLKSALNDNEHVIRWNAALLLAQRNDDSGKSVLTDLVRNEIQAASAPTGGRPQRYVDYFGRMPMEDDPNNPGLVTDDNKRACRIAAVQQLARIDPQGCLALIEEVSLHDADLVVRNAALRALPELKKRASQASQQTDFKP
jgi:HEAT repeat protein